MASCCEMGEADRARVRGAQRCTWLQVYLLPTSKKAREEGGARLGGKGEGRGGESALLLDDDDTGSSRAGAGLDLSQTCLPDRSRSLPAGSSLPGASLLRGVARPLSKRTREAPADGSRATLTREGQTWPVGVPADALPPLASRLGFRALPARLAYAAREPGPPARGCLGGISPMLPVRTGAELRPRAGRPRPCRRLAAVGRLPCLAGDAIAPRLHRERSDRESTMRPAA